MANAALSTNLTANSVDLCRSDFGIMVTITRGLDEVWEVRGRDTILPGVDGRVPRVRLRDTLAIEAEGWVLGTGSTYANQLDSFRTHVDALRALMDPTQDPYTLTVTLEDGGTRSIEARPVNILWGNHDRPTYRTCSLKWEAVEDDWDGGS